MAQLFRIYEFRKTDYELVYKSLTVFGEPSCSASPSRLGTERFSGCSGVLPRGTCLDKYSCVDLLPTLWARVEASEYVTPRRPSHHANHR